MRADEKAALRAAMLTARRQTDEAAHRAISDSVCRILASELERLSPDLVLLYAAVRGELDLSPLAEHLLSAGIRIAFPRSERGGIMHFHTVAALSELTSGLYRIPEPCETAPLASPSPRSVCIVPALAYDTAGHRLGYGGGYYDRFLKGFRGVSVGVAPSSAILDALPHEEHDLAVSAVVTEGAILRIKAAP